MFTFFSLWSLFAWKSLECSCVHHLHDMFWHVKDLLSKGHDYKSHSLFIGSFLDSIQASGLTAFPKRTTCSYSFVTGLLKTSLNRQGFPDGSDCKESGCISGGTGDVGLIPGSGRFPGEEHGYPPQYSCLQNSMDRGDWWATVHGVTQTWTWLSS